jgi:hypothetical protein
MLIDCPHCQARVNGEVRKLDAHYESEPGNDCPIAGYRVGLLNCPECGHILVGHQTLFKPAGFDAINDPEEWSGAVRVWPDPVSQLAISIPESVRACLLEAHKCLHATAYTACVAMSGRAIEAMCRHFGTKRETLFEGLKELHDRGVIDKRLYEWGDELRKHRNLAAHASGAKFNLTDAKDLYDFSTAICDYVFVLTEKFESFKKRQAQQAAQA